MKFSRMLSFLLVLCLFTGLASAVAEEEKITLRYAYWGSTYENEAMQSIAAKYEAENPNVDIECIYIPNADYTTKMTAMIASGDEPTSPTSFPATSSAGPSRDGLSTSMRCWKMTTVIPWTISFPTASLKPPMAWPGPQYCKRADSALLQCGPV